MSGQKKRTRLTPEARRAQLLEVAKTIIVEDGLQGFSMEALARRAEVSSPLVYNYFDSRIATLQALLVAEHATYAQRVRRDVSRAENFEDIVRAFVRSNVEHFTPGNIIPILSSQPEIASAIAEQRRQERQDSAQFLVNAAASTYALSRPQAELLVQMSSAASIAAAEWGASRRVSKARTIDAAVGYILAGIAHLAATDER